MADLSQEAWASQLAEDPNSAILDVRTAGKFLKVLFQAPFIWIFFWDKVSWMV